jgi:RNA polymerase sigma-70 factor (ECF subfamily)
MPALLKPRAHRVPSNLEVGTVSDSAETSAPGRPEEREWVERARAGDTQAFRRLVERYGDHAYGLAYRMLGSDSEAEEVAQDAFLRAWRALPRFRGESSFSTWLHRIVVRRALDRSATLKARRAREVALEDADTAALEAPAGAETAAGRDRTRKLDRLLDLLTDVQRAAVTLYYYEDQSVDDVARTLEIPVGTVKTHLHRARALLRAGWIEEEYQ